MTDFVTVNGVRLTVADAIGRAEDIATVVRATEGALKVLETAAALKRLRLAALQDAQDPYTSKPSPRGVARAVRFNPQRRQRRRAHDDQR